MSPKAWMPVNRQVRMSSGPTVPDRMGGTVVPTVGTVPRVGDDRETTAAWIAAGLGGLTGRADGPALLPPAATIAAIAALVAAAPVDEPLVLLGERSALAGRRRAGATSCGGSARLLAAADGWVAVNLARTEDVDLIPAWLGLASDPDDPWAAAADAVRCQPAGDLVTDATELGLPVSAVGKAPGPDPRGPGRGAAEGAPGDGSTDGPGPSAVVARRSGVIHTRVADREPIGGAPLVVDLSSLWAGPLCSHLLELKGARVVTVESSRRPDGARQDETGFFDLLNVGKASVALDLPSTFGLARLRGLLRAADVVIEGSRPRALRGWGIDAESYLAAEDGPRVWVSITAHGRTGPAANRVGFGDDAAAAGGLVVSDDDGPCFLLDAVADPLTGIAVARAVEEALAEGGTWLLDAALARVASSVARPGPAVALTDAARPPRFRPVPGPARPLGADTDTVLAELARR